MELDTPCRGLKLKNFKEMISNVADIFRTQALEQFGEIKCKSLLNVFSYQCDSLTKATRTFRNTEPRRVEVINRCSNLLVSFHQLNYEQWKVLKSSERCFNSPDTQAEQQEVSRMQNQNCRSEDSHQPRKLSSFVCHGLENEVDE